MRLMDCQPPPYGPQACRDANGGPVTHVGSPPAEGAGLSPGFPGHLLGAPWGEPLIAGQGPVQCPDPPDAPRALGGSRPLALKQVWAEREAGAGVPGGSCIQRRPASTPSPLCIPAPCPQPADMPVVRVPRRRQAWPAPYGSRSAGAGARLSPAGGGPSRAVPRVRVCAAAPPGWP